MKIAFIAIVWTATVLFLTGCGSSVSEPASGPSVVPGIGAGSESETSVQNSTPPLPAPGLGVPKPVTFKDKNEELAYLIKKGTLKEVEKVVSEGADPAVFVGNTNALQLAAVVGRADVIKFLLTQKVNVDAMGSTSPNDMTALMYASSRTHYDCVELLLKAGAAVNLKTSKSSTALDFAEWAVRRTYVSKAKTKEAQDIINLLKSKGGKLG